MTDNASNGRDVISAAGLAHLNTLNIIIIIIIIIIVVVVVIRPLVVSGQEKMKLYLP